MWHKVANGLRDRTRGFEVLYLGRSLFRTALGEKRKGSEMSKDCYFQYLYEMPPTDWFEGFLHFGEYINNLKAGILDKIVDYGSIVQAFKLLDEAFYIAFGTPNGSSLSVQETFHLSFGPFISAIPGDDGCESFLLITFKIQNNGTTYLLSPIEIPKLAEWETDFIERKLEIRNGALDPERNDSLGMALPDILDEPVIYFLQSKRGPIKIGATTRWNLKKRLSILQSLSRHELGKLTFVGLIHGSFKEEKELHKKFAYLLKSKEWFFPGPELIDFIKNLPEIKWKIARI